MIATAPVRIVALLLLLLAGSQVFACDIADACIATAGDCDQPQGDNCLCCCHHVIPIAAFVLEPSEPTSTEPAALFLPDPVTPPSAIDHPPQL